MIVSPEVIKEVDESNQKEFGKTSFKNHIGINNIGVHKIPNDLRNSIEEATDCI